MEILIATTVTFRGRAFPVITERRVEAEPTVGDDVRLGESGDQWIETTSRTVDPDGRLVATGPLHDKTGSFTQDFAADGGAVLWAAGFIPDVRRSIEGEQLRRLGIGLDASRADVARQLGELVADGSGKPLTLLPGWYQDAVRSWARSRGASGDECGAPSKPGLGDANAPNDGRVLGTRASSTPEGEQ